MMKRLRYCLLAVLALFTLTVSCVDPLEPVPNNQSSIPDDALVFSPKVLGITPATKTTPGEDNRGENTVTRLDVFVYKTTGGTSTFHKQYTIGDGSAAINLGVDHLLETNWRLNYTTTDTYRIYAIANINANKLNNPVLPTSPTEAQLLALTSESDATITGQYGYTCYDIVRLQNLEGTIPAEAGSLDHHISKKLFLMDGKVDSWQIDQTAQKQYFTNQADKSYPLSRAAAKFRVTLNFSDEFKDRLGTPDADSLKFTTVTEYQDKRDTNGNLVLDDSGQPVQIPKTERIITIGAIAKNADDQVYANGTVTGGARVKFSNILKATYNFAPEAKTDTSVPNSDAQDAFRDANLWDSQNFYEFSYRTPNGTYGTGTNAVQLYKYPYIDTTYSYAFSWNAAQAAEKAPALAVSIIYTTYIQNYNQDGSFDGQAVSDGGVTNYYRIPLVDITKTGADAVNSIERNYYYQVDALINTMGTSSTEIEPMKLKLNYRVIPWPYAPDEVTEAQTTQLQYFVAETSYRLRGDGAASTQLQYFTPKSDPIETGSQYNKATPKIRNVKIYYIDQDGNERVLATSTADFNAAGGYTWSTTDGGEVSISVVPARDKKGGGDFIVSSTSLANRSVRYIEFDAYVDFAYDSGVEIERHITVTHFPLDNIQSIPGAWSSRWDGQEASGTTTTYYRKKFYKSSITSEPASQAQWAAGVRNNNDDRRNANSAATAVNGYYATGGSSTTERFRHQGTFNTYDISSITGYTWNGTGVTFTGISERPWDSGRWSQSYNGYDYVVNYGVDDGYAVINLWKYDNYYHLVGSREESYSPTGNDGTWTSYDGFEWEACTQAQYNAAAAENRKVETVKNHPGVANNWVDWPIAYNNGQRNGNTGRTVSNTDERITFSAQYWGPYYNEASNSIYSIDYNNGRYSGTQQSLTNHHMYVIQISKAEEGVILGRPSMDDYYQSNDNVVSPAFMIASQLGATSVYTSDAYTAARARAAANHCASYMEVSENGRRFTGWRLPTIAEIEYIIGYQSNEDVTSSGVFTPVVTGYHYYTLNPDSQGNRYATTTYSSATGYFVRCIRDLTPAEVIELNETGTITAASY